MTSLSSSLANFERCSPPAHAAAPSPGPAHGQVALLLNCNARSVDAACLARLRAILGPAHVFASHDLAEAEAMARHVVEAGYSVVACGGGDGTLADAINRVGRNLRQSNARRRLRPRTGLQRSSGLRPNLRPSLYPSLQKMPKFAFLPLGTGNALKRVVHGHDVEAHLAALAAGERFADITVPLIEDEEGGCFFFGGMGYDSLLLHDYNRLLAAPRPAWAQPLVRSLAGYLAALGRDTLPRVLRGDAPLAVRVVTQAKATYFDARNKDAPVALAAGSVLYDGPAGMLGVGTVPYFGYGMKVFPFAGRIGQAMQLRVARLSALQVLAQLAPIWRGSYRNPEQVLDFAVTKITVTLAQPFPFERCGDDRGPVSELRLRVARTPVTLLDFGRPRATTRLRAAGA